MLARIFRVGRLNTVGNQRHGAFQRIGQPARQHRSIDGITSARGMRQRAHQSIATTLVAASDRLRVTLPGTREAVSLGPQCAQVPSLCVFSKPYRGTRKVGPVLLR